MAAIQVRASGKKTGNVVFDQPAGAKPRGSDVPARVVIRADGNAVTVDGALKVVKDAIQRGDLVQVGGDPVVFEEAERVLESPDATDRQRERARKVVEG
jgi:hypothetical protein